MKTSIFDTRDKMGAGAADWVSGIIENKLKTQEKVRVIFAAAPSQNEFLFQLAGKKNIDWSRIEAFHMDEYHTLPKGHPELFSGFLSRNLFDKVPLGRIEFIEPGVTNVAEECLRYAALLNEHPVDICCLGIGENGHLAFNDPPVADFNDPVDVKEVELDFDCRVQQVNDAGFAHIDEVPKKALTLTIPALLRSQYLSVVVPGSRKALAVRNTFNNEISTACPATILRRHPDTHIFLDNLSASMLG